MDGGQRFLVRTAGWLKTLPASVQTQTPVRLAFVDCYLNSTNWQGLRSLTSSADWGEIDFLRLAFLSRTWSEAGRAAHGGRQLAFGNQLAGERLGAMTALLELANRWQLTRESEDLLWRILRQYPDARWAQDRSGTFLF